MYGFGSFGMYSLISILVPLIFIIVFGMIIFTMIKGVGQWNSNNKQPVITVVAEIVAKRGHTSRSNHNHGDNMHSSTSTTYYATFQGTRYHGFEFC